MCFCARSVLTLLGALCLSVLVFTPAAHAHPNALSRVDVYLGSDSTRVELDLDGTSSVDLIARQLGLAPPPDLADLASHQARLVRYAESHLSLKADGQRCTPKDAGNQRFSRAKNRLYLRLGYHCPWAPKQVVLESRLFTDESTPHQILGGVHRAGRYQRSLLAPQQPVAFTTDSLPLAESAPHTFRMATPPASAGVALANARAAPAADPDAVSVPPPPKQPTGLSFSAFLGEGWRHILGGYDHLLFVFTLVLGAVSLRELTRWITAFTLAHSLSLALSALELVKVSPRLIEPLIALSIVWVGVETARGRRGHRRAGMVFAFGLLHGLGFGGALFELGLNRNDVATPLLGFNLGVELGQLVVVLPCFAVLAWQRKHHAKWNLPLRTWAGAVSSLVASIWFLERLVA
ncbi:MAG: HupE/UreJ family protein [Polyangiaceae bacterium]|nr:HupE/UreJ family protein [Myxococcales bacterium]MCB9584591.1 HupE/UreJ family protein [Polyangiaceae bacterium]